MDENNRKPQQEPKRSLFLSILPYILIIAAITGIGVLMTVREITLP